MIATLLLSAALSCAHQPLFTSGEIAQDASSVYVISQDRRRILRLFKNGGASVVVDSRFEITAFDVDGPFIYYGLDLGFEPLKQLHVVTITGGAPATLANDSQAFAQITHDERAIYWREPISEVWRYDKRTAVPKNLILSGANIIYGSDDDTIYIGVGRSPVTLFTQPKSGAPGEALQSGVGDVFVDGSAIYFTRDGKIWRISKSGSLPFPVATLPDGVTKLFGVGANRVFTSAAMTDICSGKVTLLHRLTRIAVDSCAAYEVVNDELVVTPLAAPTRIDTVDPDPAGDGTRLRLIGAGFDRLATVQIDGKEVAVVGAGETELDVIVPQPDAIGGKLTVRNRDGACAATFLNFFKSK